MPIMLQRCTFLETGHLLAERYHGHRCLARDTAASMAYLPVPHKYMCPISLEIMLKPTKLVRSQHRKARQDHFIGLHLTCINTFNPSKVSHYLAGPQSGQGHRGQYPWLVLFLLVEACERNKNDVALQIIFHKLQQ